MPLATHGFDVLAERAHHWHKHRSDFEPPSITELEYEALADVFLTKPAEMSILECRRSDGRCCRFDTRTNEYGVLSHDKRIVTYFKPKPSVHHYRTNVAYFRAKC
jgi:pyocin large subunit-like protein